MDRPPPTFALGFAMTQPSAAERVKHWLRTRHPWSHSGLKKAPLQDVRGIYVPAYLYSALAQSEYSASIGENYTETETYTTTENGKTVTKTRTVTKTEWRSLSGEHAEYVPDVLVTASRGLTNVELEHLEPFDLRMLARYEPALVAGWIAEEPSLSREECLAMARQEAMEKVKRRLDAFMPGDSHRMQDVNTRLSAESLEVCLVPVWVLAARYDPEKPPLRVVVNGQSGEVHGEVPISWVKVALTVVAVAVLVLVVYLMNQGGRP
ncbi:Primosomal protein N [Archangium gephyra]|uniref:Primosomal protein N n=1 Tax=Archangium gephyra TaxID=48 RepID=A0AAC8Q032_9BACT|nr:Primosomal protein N [Archangium gephyra]